MKIKSFIPAIAVIIVFLSVNAAAQLTWSSQPYNINALFFLQSNASLGWACGDFGVLLATTNGGDVWFAQNSDTKIDFNCIAFADDKAGVAVGNNGIIYGSSDGGKNWLQRSSPTTNNLTAVRFAPSQSSRGYAVGHKGTILLTTDAGVSWQPLYSPSTSDLTDISPLSESVAEISGNNGVILRTVDGGATWRSINSGVTLNINGIYILSSQATWVAGDSGYIAKTSNNGVSWIKQSSGTTARLSSVHFSGITVGWAVGAGGIILKTIDGGANWTSVNDSNRSIGNDIDDLSKVFAGGAASAHKAWICGKSGLILATRDGGFNWMRQAEKPKGQLFGIYFDANEINGWAVGAYGNIYATSSGGKIWQKQTSGTGVTLNSVKFTSARQGIAAGDDGTLLLTANGGVSWSKINTGTSDNIRSSTFLASSPSKGFVSGTNGLVLLTSDGGGTWQKSATPKPMALNGVHFADPQFGCAVGALGEIVVSYNGGTTWQSQTSGTTQELRGVCLANWTTGWAVGGNSTILKTQNSGVSWTNLSFLQPPRTLNAVQFTDNLNGWIAGAGGTILSTRDAGANWKQLSGITTDNITALSFPNARSGWFAGEHASIIRVEDNTDYLLTPLDKQSEVDTKPAFTWLKHIGSNGYKVIYSTSLKAVLENGSGGAITLLTSNESDTSAVPTSFLNPNTVYYWAVEERATGFRLGVRSFATSVGPVRALNHRDSVRVCSGKDTLLTILTADGQPPLSYVWRQSNGKTIPQDEIISQTGATLRLSPQANRDIICIVTDAFNHSDSALISVSINIVQPVIVKSQEFLCSGSSVRLSTVKKYSVYEWTRNQSPIGNDSIFDVVLPGKYYVTARDSDGCSGVSEEIIFNENPTPLPIIEGAENVCVNQKNAPYRAGIFSPGRSYLWHIDSGASRAVITSGENLSTVTINFGGKGIVTLRLREIFNATQCYADTTLRIIVDDSGFRPAVTSRSGAFVLCGGATDTLDAPPGFAKYQWRRDNQDIPDANEQRYIVSEEGIYSVYAEDAGGCKGVSDALSYKKGDTPQPVIIGDKIACEGAKDLVYNIKSPLQGSSYLWDASGGASIIGSNQGSSITIGLSGSGSGVLNVREKNAAGCLGYASFSIVIKSAPKPIISGSHRFCAGQSAILDAGEGDAYRWYLNGVETPFESKRTLNATKPGDYKTTVSKNGCEGTSEIFAVEEELRPDSAYFEDIRSGLLTAPAAAAWQWYYGAPPDTIPIAGAQNRTYMPTSAGTYSVVASNAFGCSTLVVITAFGDIQLGSFAILDIDSHEDNVTIKSNETARFELRLISWDSVKASALGIIQCRIKVQWDKRLLNGVFPAAAPDSSDNFYSWEFVAPVSRLNGYSQRLSFAQFGKYDSLAIVSVFVRAEDNLGASQRGKASANGAVVKFSEYSNQHANSGDNLEISDITPNPADEKTTLTIRGKPNETVEVYLEDNLGKRIQNFAPIPLSSDGKGTMQFTTVNLANGQYFITVKRGNITASSVLQINR